MIGGGVTGGISVGSGTSVGGGSTTGAGPGIGEGGAGPGSGLGVMCSEAGIWAISISSTRKKGLAPLLKKGRKPLSIPDRPSSATILDRVLDVFLHVTCC